MYRITPIRPILMTNEKINCARETVVLNNVFMEDPFNLFAHSQCTPFHDSPQLIKAFHFAQYLIR